MLNANKLMPRGGGLAAVLLKEPVSARVAVGVALIVAGTLLTLR